MKKIVLILTLLLSSFSFAFAQEEDLTRQEKIQALYVAYVTQQLQLTPDEAQKFWPLHTQFEADLKNIKRDLPELDKQQARLDIKKKYQDGFIKIVGPARSERFYRMRDEFRRKLIERMDKQGNNVRPNPRQRGRPNN
jgi:Skp family chaperone for outer membrane proteins